MRHFFTRRTREGPSVLTVAIHPKNGTPGNFPPLRPTPYNPLDTKELARSVEGALLETQPQRLDKVSAVRTHFDTQPRIAAEAKLPPAVPDVNPTLFDLPGQYDDDMDDEPAN
jgi:hypothetical protein